MMQLNFRIGSWLLFLMIMMMPAMALSQSFTASVDRNSMAVGDQFKIDFTLSNAEGKGFAPPSFNDFNYLAGPMTSQSMSITNGSYSKSITWTYYFQAKSEGTFKIGAATINADNKTLSTIPITITVSKGQQKANGNQQGQGDDGTGVSDKNVFLRASASKTNVYRGESLVITYKLYTNIALVNLNIEKMPALNGLWSSDIEVPQPYQFKNETVNGISYKAAVIKKVVVFPQQSGNLTVDAMKGEVTAQIQVKSKRNSNQWDPFGVFNDAFGQVQNVPVKINSQAIKLNVKELPAGAPESFNGSVGNFTMTAFLDKPETKANEAVNLKIKVTGSGNLKLIDSPKLNMPADIETYDPKTNENINVTESGASGSKTFEYLLIPRHEGSYTIEPVEFSYFDLQNNKYVTLKSKAFDLKVTKGDGSGAATVVDAGNLSNKSEIAVIGKDIHYIKTNNVIFSNSTQGFFGSWLFYALLVAPLFLVSGAYMYRSHLIKMNGDMALVKSRGATKMAKKRMAIAGKLLKENKNEMFYDEVGKALWGYLSDKLVLPVSDLSKETAIQKLTDMKVSEDTIKNLTSTIDNCEMARFAPSVVAAPQTIYNDAVQLITKIEGELG